MAVRGPTAEALTPALQRPKSKRPKSTMSFQSCSNFCSVERAEVAGSSKTVWLGGGFAMGHEWDDEDECEGGVEMGLMQTEPGARSAEKEVWPVAFDAEPVQSKGQGSAKQDQQQPERRRGLTGCRVKDGDDGEADGVVGHGEQQEERDAWMCGAEGQPGHEPCHRNIGGRGNAPAAPKGRPAKKMIQHDIACDRQCHPPTVAKSGLMAFLRGWRLPPGQRLEVISDGMAMLKKRTMKRSLVREVEALDAWQDWIVDGVMIGIEVEVGPDEPR